MNKLKKGSQLFVNSQKRSASDPSSYFQKKVNEKPKDSSRSKISNNFLNNSKSQHCYPFSSPQTTTNFQSTENTSSSNSQAQQKPTSAKKGPLEDYKTQFAIVLWVGFLELLREIYVKTKDKVSDRIVNKILGTDNDSLKNDPDPKFAFDSIPSNFGPIDPDYYHIDAYFDQAREILKGKQVLIISGPAGVGKSSFAESYAQQYYKESGQFHSFKRCGTETIQNFYMKLVEEKDKEKQIQLANQFFRKIKQEILFVFDNIEDLGVIEEYLNNLPLNVKVIITSRDSSSRYANLALEPFTKLQSRNFLQKLLKNTNIEKVELLDQFVEVVGNAPLDLKIASKCFKGQNNSLEQFLSEHQNDPFYKHLFHKLAKNHSNAWKLLQYISKLDPEFISYSLLQKIFENDEIASWMSKLSDSSSEPDFNVINFFKNNCKGKELSKNLQLLESWGLLEPLIYQEKKGCKTYNQIQMKVLEFSNKHQELAIKKEVLNQELIRGIIQEYQSLRKTSEKQSELLIYAHARKLQGDWIQKFLPFTNIQEGIEFLCMTVCKKQTYK